jgi:hypothetical protein
VAGTRRRPLRRCSPGRAPTTASAGESERQPAATVERLVIVMVCPSEPLPHRGVQPGMRPRETTTGRRRPPPGNPAARHRRPAGDANGRPQPATGAPSSPARRPDRLAVYMGCCANRREGHVSAARATAGHCRGGEGPTDTPARRSGQASGGAGRDVRVSSAAGVSDSPADTLASPACTGVGPMGVQPVADAVFLDSTRSQRHCAWMGLARPGVAIGRSSVALCQP